METKASKPKYYTGAPDKCDICEGPFGKWMYDARTRGGRWANLCPRCFTAHAYGVGVGKGQEYTLQRDGKWLKTGG